METQHSESDYAAPEGSSMGLIPTAVQNRHSDLESFIDGLSLWALGDPLTAMLTKIRSSPAAWERVDIKQADHEENTKVRSSQSCRWQNPSLGLE